MVLWNENDFFVGADESMQRLSFVYLNLCVTYCHGSVQD